MLNIAQKKEHLFTKRIYHTHHKAEKVMGFINEDLDIVIETISVKKMEKTVIRALGCEQIKVKRNSKSSRKNACEQCFQFQKFRNWDWHRGKP